MRWSTTHLAATRPNSLCRVLASACYSDLLRHHRPGAASHATLHHPSVHSSLCCLLHVLLECCTCQCRTREHSVRDGRFTDIRRAHHSGRLSQSAPAAPNRARAASWRCQYCARDACPRGRQQETQVSSGYSRVNRPANGSRTGTG